MIVVSMINLLLCLISNMLDLKLIEEGKFKPKKEIFKPRDTLDFILAMFEPHLRLVNSTLSVTIAEEDGEEISRVPETLLGDQIRLK